MGKGIKENKTVVTTTMSKAYQITVPSVIRKALGLEPGDPVDFEIERGRVTLVRAETREEKIRRAFADLDEWREGLSDEVKENIKKYAGWTANQHREYYDSLPESKVYMKEKYGIQN